MNKKVGDIILDVTVYTLEDGMDYSLVDSLIYNDNVYVLLANMDDISNICIRKLIRMNNKEYFQKLGDEFEKVYSLFIEKNINLLNE